MLAVAVAPYFHFFVSLLFNFLELGAVFSWSLLRLCAALSWVTRIRNCGFLWFASSPLWIFPSLAALMAFFFSPHGRREITCFCGCGPPPWLPRHLTTPRNARGFVLDRLGDLWIFSFGKLTCFWWLPPLPGPLWIFASLAAPLVFFFSPHGPHEIARFSGCGTPPWPPRRLTTPRNARDFVPERLGDLWVFSFGNLRYFWWLSPLPGAALPLSV